MYMYLASKTHLASLPQHRIMEQLRASVMNLNSMLHLTAHKLGQLRLCDAFGFITDKSFQDMIYA